MASELLHLDVACDRDAPFAVRDALDRIEEIAPVREDARLIASELVSNAVLHSGAGADQLLQVRAILGDHCLLISVSDPGLSGQTATLRLGDEPARGGYGLLLVQRLARRWGWERPDRNRVWAELELGE